MTRSKFYLFGSMALAVVAGIVWLTGSPAPTGYIADRAAVSEAASPLSYSIDFGEGNVRAWVDVAYRSDATVFDLLKDLAATDTIAIDYQPSTGLGVLVRQIGDRVNGDGDRYWTYRVNGEFATVAADRYVVKPGDTVQWSFSVDGK